MKISYNWLKEYLGDGAPTPEKIEELLTFHAFEIEGVEAVGDDTVLDIDVLPNRSSDCLCHRGIAREIATLTNIPLASDPLATEPTLPNTDVIAVTIEDPAACPRFTAALITGVTVGESPQWLKDRLTAIGQRPINNIVDATNYVMFAIGQPLHAYDADLFPQTNGQWQFVVRKATPGEQVSLLAEGGKDEDRVVELTGEELLIVDGSSDTPIGLAGVKGGRYAGVHEGTTKIIIEAAHFDPILTRKTARRLGIVIDASKRFENEPSRELPLYAQSEIIALIQDIAGGAGEGVIDTYLEKKPNPSIVFNPEHANSLLGIELSEEEMVSILTRVGCTVEGDGPYTVTGPWERTDLTIEEDLIEEVGRVHGLSSVASIVPHAAPLTELNKRHYYSEKIRSLLLALGFSEVITSSFRAKDSIQLFNALASDKTYLRSSLTHNLDETLQQNLPHRDLLGLAYVAVFEIGTVFTKTETGINEHMSLAFGVRHKNTGETKQDKAVLAAAVDALHETLGISLNAESNSGVIECNLTELLATLPEPAAYDPIEKSAAVSYQPFSPYPAIARDVALWVDENTAPTTVEQVLNEHAGELRVRTTLFDEFSKDGRTSYAFRLVFQSHEKTLTDDEVNDIMDVVYAAVDREGWEVR